MTNYIENYENWLNSTFIDDTDRYKLLQITDQYELKECFYKDLEFGTGGMRGIMGLGTNRMNNYTIRKSTQGLANFINLLCDNQIKSVVIAFDSRNHSKEFALETALVFAANQIRTYLFESLRPTPELSFAVRELKCNAGIVITASHNPAKYNGYKVYGPDGGQITDIMASKITAQIERVDIFKDIHRISELKAIEDNLLVYISEEIDKGYQDQIMLLHNHVSNITSNNRIKVVYTPLHGSGMLPIAKLFSKLNFDYTIVESQQNPDGDFPTVESPNPEDRNALLQGIELATQIDADLVLGTDPDADRLGVAVKLKDNSYGLLSGNQVGALLVSYIILRKRHINKFDVLIKTIVTSDLGAKIASSNGVSVINTLTGFKYIGEKILEFENTNFRFLFGYEESYGYLAGTYARDKDAVLAAMLVTEMAQFYKLQNKNLVEVLDELQQTYGYHLESLDSFVYEGYEGVEKINNIVSKFRDIKNLSRFFDNIEFVEDYLSQNIFNKDHKIISSIELPISNVIKIYFEDSSWIAVRPSGTEPKLKVYFSCVSNSKVNAEMRLQELINLVHAYIEK